MFAGRAGELGAAVQPQPQPDGPEPVREPARPSTVRRQPRLQKASDVLADRLRARIIGRGMSPGEPLPSEAELIHDEGFSRGTVREALRLLESDGLIEIRRGPRGGIRVAHPDLTQVSRSVALLLTLAQTSMRSFSEFRRLVEPAAAASAARSATAEQRQWLLELAEQSDLRTALWEPSVEFHTAIAACSDNEILRVVVAAFGQELTWHAPGDRLTHEDMDETKGAHRRVARAIAAGDAERASRTMRRHLEKFEAVLAIQGRLDEPVVPREQWLEG
jgi:GntR family transcriptional repressor for pyruvate dehydrogenase complex